MNLHGGIRKKLLGMISALILASVLLVTALSYQSYRGDLIKQSTEHTQLLLDQLALNVDTYLSEVFRLCLSPYYNKRVMAQLEYTPQTPAEKLLKQRVVEDYLSEVMMLPRSDILRAHILTDRVYSSSKTRYDAHIPEKFTQTDWYIQALKDGEAIFISTQANKLNGIELPVFSVVKQLCSTKDSGKVLGVIRVDANYNGIKATCDRTLVGEGNALLILDGADKRIYENEHFEETEYMEEILTLLHKHEGESTFFASLGGKQVLLNTKFLNVTDWRIVDVHSMRSLMAAALNARNKSFGLAALCASLGVLFSVMLARMFLHPIFEITGLMQRVQEGDLSVRAKVSGHDELAYLGKSFNQMTEKIDHTLKCNTNLTRQVYEARYLEKEAQYAALCSQIRPHFLFNALNTIALLVKTGRVEESAQCIDMLATLLRGMVNTDREITLQAELRIVKSYLSLQQKRYDTLSYELPNAEGYENYVLPALTLQPLVENAIVHGCEPKRGSAHISLLLKQTANELWVTVTDNGVGMDEAALLQLNLQLESDTLDLPDGNAPISSVGLINISRRVKLKYGSSYGLNIFSKVGTGTMVTLRLPIETGKDRVFGASIESTMKKRGDENVPCIDC